MGLLAQLQVRVYMFRRLLRLSKAFDENCFLQIVTVFITLPYEYPRLINTLFYSYITFVHLSSCQQYHWPDPLHSSAINWTVQILKCNLTRYYSPLLHIFPTLKIWMMYFGSIYLFLEFEYFSIIFHVQTHSWTIVHKKIISH